MLIFAFWDFTPHNQIKPYFFKNRIADIIKILLCHDERAESSEAKAWYKQIGAAIMFADKAHGCAINQVMLHWAVVHLWSQRARSEGKQWYS